MAHGKKTLPAALVLVVLALLQHGVEALPAGAVSTCPVDSVCPSRTNKNGDEVVRRCATDGYCREHCGFGPKLVPFEGTWRCECKDNWYRRPDGECKGCGKDATPVAEPRNKDGDNTDCTCKQAVHANARKNQVFDKDSGQCVCPPRSEFDDESNTCKCNGNSVDLGDGKCTNCVYPLKNNSARNGCECRKAFYSRAVAGNGPQLECVKCDLGLPTGVERTTQNNVGSGNAVDCICRTGYADFDPQTGTCAAVVV